DTVPGAVATGSRLLSAQLKIRKSDQRSIAETLVIARGGDRWRYRISEAAFLLLNAADAPRSEFDADRLPGHALEGSARSSNERVLPQRNGLPDNVSPAAVASADLEVEVTYLLDQVKANLGEQISVTRTAGGKLLVQGIVDSDKRKAQIVQALAEVSSNPAVRLDILTVAEAMHRRTQAESPGAVRRVEVNGSATIPVYGRLRSHFEKSGIASEQIDDQIKKFAAAALSDSREALRHAWALKRLAQEFSPEELQSLGPEARARRGQMIIEHARSARDELAKLSQQLGQVFGLQRPTAEAFPVTGDGAVSNEIAELTDSISAIDESVRSDFTVTAGSASSSSVDSAGFWRQLDKAQKLAESIRNRTK
ncbi:MAG TPA: hypothetical protein VEZ90_00855, partial [Blastocatellia bacterium]|nr:hypothetical protein [Blastocatellia bacterium]